jgi:hypothetical protein
MEDSNPKPGVVVVHSNLRIDEFEHLDVRLPNSMVIVRPTATNEELRSVGIEPLTPEEAQRLKERTAAELRDPSRISVIDEPIGFEIDTSSCFIATGSSKPRSSNALLSCAGRT